MRYIIEHMEPELFEWCVIEYEHISSIVGKENLIVTNVEVKDHDKVKHLGTIESKKVSELSFSKLCVLDPYATTSLTPSDNESFEHMVFGGILGNNPAAMRTKELTKVLPCPTRQLGPDQLSTDTAVYVTKTILDGTKYDDIHFVSEVEIERDDGESIILPFKYVVDGKTPVISSKLVEYVQEHGFD